MANGAVLCITLAAAIVCVAGLLCAVCSRINDDRNE